MMKKLWNRFAAFVYNDRIDKAFVELQNDLSSLKALWNHIYLAVFIVLCWYVAVTNKAAHGTVITVFGGVVSVIFTAYITATTVEKVKGVGKYTPPSKEEDGGSEGA